MSPATMRATNAARGGRDDEGGSTVWFWLIVLAVFALLGFLVAWLGGWIRFTTDPRVTEILAMQEEARGKFAAGGGPATLGEATAAVAAMNAVSAKIDALPKPLRQQVERSGSSMMRGMYRDRINAYLAAPPAQRNAVLDRQIDQEEIMRKAFEAGSAVARVFGGGQRGGGSGGGPPRGGSQDDRNKWRKDIIDRTSPEERARYSEYRRAMEERRTERGLPSGYGR